MVGAVEEDVVSTCALKHRNGGAPDAISVVVGQGHGLGVTQYSATGVNAVWSDYNVIRINIEGQVVINHLVRTSIARVVANHRELGVGIEGECAVDVAVNGRRAGFATCEVLLLAPAIKGELILDCTRVQRQGHSPHTIPVIIRHGVA